MNSVGVPPDPLYKTVCRTQLLSTFSLLSVGRQPSLENGFRANVSPRGEVRVLGITHSQQSEGDKGCCHLLQGGTNPSDSKL